MASKPSGRGNYPVQPVEVATWALVGAVVVAVLGLASFRWTLGPDDSRDYASRSLPAEPLPVLLAAPEVDDEYLPCRDCHEKGDPINREVRELDDEHDEMAFGHGDLWCYQCHDKGNQQRLHLSDGTPLEFEDSWQLCTQCHGKKLADWRAGVHGKRTGYWWGPKEYRTCVVCHEPHSPSFKSLKPERPPMRPEDSAPASLAAAEVAHAGE